MVPRERRLRAYEKVNVLTVIKAFDASRSSMQHQAKSFNAIDSSFQGLELLTTGIVVVSREREREREKAGVMREKERASLIVWSKPGHSGQHSVRHNLSGETPNTRVSRSKCTYHA
jgi:hypothetical protein